MSKRINRFLVGILSFTLALGVVGCKDKDSSKDKATDSDAVATMEDADTTEESTTATATEAEIIDVCISVDKTQLEMEIGDKIQVIATVTPEDLEDYRLLWSSSNTGVAAVVDGEIEAVAAGSCVITVKVSGESDKAQINVTVLPNETESGDMGNNNDVADSGSGDNSGTGNSGSGAGNNSGSGSGSGAGNSGSGTGNTGSDTGNGAGSGSGSNSGTSSTTEATTETTTEAQQDAYYLEYANAVLTLVNEERAKVGAPALTLDSSINAAAKVRAKECATSFSHTRPDGSSCFTALDQAGVSYSGCGENIAAGYWSPESVVAGWVSSSGHYANMINPSYTRMGLGCWYDSESDYGVYWAQMFAY